MVLSGSATAFFSQHPRCLQVPSLTNDSGRSSDSRKPPHIQAKLRETGLSRIFKSPHGGVTRPWQFFFSDFTDFARGLDRNHQKHRISRASSNTKWLRGLFGSLNSRNCCHFLGSGVPPFLTPIFAPPLIHRFWQDDLFLLPYFLSSYFSFLKQ